LWEKVEKTVVMVGFKKLRGKSTSATRGKVKTRAGKE